MVPTKVVIADDHTLFREGIKECCLLKRTFSSWGSLQRRRSNKACGAHQAGCFTPRSQNAQGRYCSDPARSEGHNPATKVLVLTAFSEDENILNAAKGGARGYVLKALTSLRCYEPSRPSRAAVCGSTKSCPRPTCLRKLPRTSLMIAAMPERTMRPSRF